VWLPWLKTEVGTNTAEEMVTTERVVTSTPSRASRAVAGFTPVPVST